MIQLADYESQEERSYSKVWVLQAYSVWMLQSYSVWMLQSYSEVWMLQVYSEVWMLQAYSEVGRNNLCKVDGERGLGGREKGEEKRGASQIWEEMGEKYRGSEI
jgi:hypothetical protein